jgi:hypothetical protein
MIAYNFGGFNPADTKETTPIYRIDYTDTPFTVKSDGIRLDRYLLDSQNSVPNFLTGNHLTFVDTLYTHILGFYSSSGAPIGFHYTDNFGFRYRTKFYAKEKGVYTIKVYGYGFFNFSIFNYDAKTVQFPFNAGGFFPLKSKDAFEYPITLGANTWYDLDFHYYSTSGDAGFTCMWKNNVTNKYIPISAGVCTLNGSYLPSNEVKNLLSISRTENRDSISTMSFEVPLVASGSTDSGYYYNTYWDKYCHSLENIALDKFKMVELKAGYNTDPNGAVDAKYDYYVPKFIGHINKFIPSRKNGKITVECLSFENFYKTTLNLNYPDIYDYWNSEYINKSVSETNPDGINCPNTFDGWELYKVFECLSMRSFIDPYLLLQQKTYLDNNNTVISGTSRLIETSQPTTVVLDTNINYGFCGLVNQDTGIPSDDTYIIKSNFGDNLFDYMNTITDVYGWQWGCNNFHNGAPYLKSNNNPYLVLTALSEKNIYSPNLVNWVGDYDVSTFSGSYLQTNNENDYFIFTAKGVKFNLITVLDNSFGSGASIKEYNGSTKRFVVEELDENFDSTFNVGSRIVWDTVNGEESGVIATIINYGSTTTHAFILEDDFVSKPLKGGTVRIATFSVEVRRGSLSGTLIQKTYHSCYFNNTYSTIIAANNLRDKSIALSNLRYYDDGIDPMTSKNPTIIPISDSLSYAQYFLKIQRLPDSEVGSTNYMRIDSLLVYDTNVSKITQTFYTGDSVVDGTIIELDVDDSVDDLRNDTIVIGRLLGVELPGAEEDRPLNPNNPTNNYVISRATDTASIYNPSVKNYAGRPLQTIQIAPELVSNIKANYWATAFIHRYRNPGKTVSFNTVGHPLMEIGDCIAVVDEGMSTTDSYNKLWITGIEDSYERNSYITKYTTTSYEPWESFVPKLPTDLTKYESLIKNLTFINAGTVAEPYDPYSADAGILVQIKYDLIVDCYVKIDIYSAEAAGDIRVATLLNFEGDSGTQGWQKQDSGKGYVVTWDGTDMFGNWNEFATSQSNHPEVIGKNYAVHSTLADYNKLTGYTYYFEGSAKFYVKFTFKQKKDTSFLSSETSMSISEKIGISGSIGGYIFTRLGNMPSFILSSYPDCKFYPSVVIQGGTDDGIPSYYAPEPKVCFNDSVAFDGQKLANKITIKQETTALRKVQINVSATYMVYSSAYWKVGGSYVRPSNSLKVLTEDEQVYTVYSDQSFKDYRDVAITRFISPKANNYNYNLETFWSPETARSMKTRDSIHVYGGFFIYVYAEIRDRSGRKVDVKVPSSSFLEQDVYAEAGTNGFWIFWIDDTYPRKQYIWQSVVADEFKFINQDGIDAAQSYNYGVLGHKDDNGAFRAPLVKIYPKVDKNGNAW